MRNRKERKEKVEVGTTFENEREEETKKTRDAIAFFFSCLSFPRDAAVLKTQPSKPQTCTIESSSHEEPPRIKLEVENERTRDCVPFVSGTTLLFPFFF